VREDLTSRGRSHPGLLSLANLRFEVSRLLPDVSSERGVAATVAIASDQPVPILFGFRSMAM
jgi:hypothetical protein